MPIEVITGLPGHGKTLLMMEKLHDAAKKAERPLFAAGIEGLAPGLATVLPDPTQWNAKDENGEHIVPDGSLIFVDEAWKWYGHLHNATGQKTPDHVLAFAEHRHRGLDFVMTTQGPGQLYPFLRTLIEGHTHVVRAMGTQAANLYTWAELNDDVKSRTMRDAALRKLWSYPKQNFNSYKSATQHTIKRKIPLRVFLMPVALLGAIGAAFIAYTYLKPSARAEAMATEEAAGGLPPTPTGTRVAAMTATQAHEPEAVAEYFAQFRPRNDAIPSSAPAYDKRRVVAQPQVYCVIAGPGETATGYDAEEDCRCLTEQGTPYKLDDAMCRMNARNGHAYDHFKQPPRNDLRRDERTARDSLQTGEAAPLSATSIEAEQVSGYGDLGTRDITSAH
ncbi:MAG: zonular occludens toxin domain-containing protein [Lysobacter sp.]